MNLIQLAKSRLEPLQHKHFRMLFAAQGISLVGSFMQELAKSWIVIHMVGKASAVGALMVAAAIPTALLSSYGGVIADRRGAKQILIITQVALACLAFATGMLVFSGHVEVWHLILIAALEGTSIAFDMPAFSTVIPQLVPREHFQKAIAVNSVNFHLSRVLGPSIAGLLMGLFPNSAPVFWLNAASFLGVVFVISRLPLRKTGASHKHEVHMKEAILHLRSHELLRRSFSQFMLMMLTVFPLVFTVIRVHMQKTFSLDAKDFGLVFAVPGIGALLGSLAFLLWNPKKPFKALPYGVIGVAANLYLLSLMHDLTTSVIALGLFSFSMFLSLSAVLITIQINVPDQIRGRVSALIGMAFVAIAPVMGLPYGFISDNFGAPPLMVLLSTIFLAGSLHLTLRALNREKQAQTVSSN